MKPHSRTYDRSFPKVSYLLKPLLVFAQHRSSSFFPPTTQLLISSRLPTSFPASPSNIATASSHPPTTPSPLASRCPLQPYCSCFISLYANPPSRVPTSSSDPHRYCQPAGRVVVFNGTVKGRGCQSRLDLWVWSVQVHTDHMCIDARFSQRSNLKSQLVDGA